MNRQVGLAREAEAHTTPVGVLAGELWAADTLVSAADVVAPLPFVGRHKELRVLADLLSGVREGHSGTLVLVGEPGIGKTSLLDQAASGYPDVRAVRIAGVESETRLAFAALHRLLRPWLPGIDALPPRNATRCARRSAALPGPRPTATWRAWPPSPFSPEPPNLSRSSAWSTTRNGSTGSPPKSWPSSPAAGDPAAAGRMLDRAEHGLQHPVLRALARQARATAEIYSGRFAAAPAILLEAAESIAGLDARLARRMMFEALQAVLLTDGHAVTLTQQDLAREVLASPATQPPAPTYTDLLLNGYATRIAVGHRSAVPLMRSALTALGTDPNLTEEGLPLAIVSMSAADDVWDDEGGRRAWKRLEAYDRAHGALGAPGARSWSVPPGNSGRAGSRRPKRSTTNWPNSPTSSDSRTPDRPSGSSSWPGAAQRPRYGRWRQRTTTSP
ncbi:ATP-binding protein [Actinomadura oligospora]|uniref:ATP-binding protein n=1 Tax=Actinomadura oligospora TaxID=111804 RepID=UPI001B8075A5|nr:ATP-binding protein [Actinomadura oligospora]